MKNYIHTLISLTAVLLLTACDPGAAAIYTINNTSDSTVTIKFNDLIPSDLYNIYEDNDNNRIGIYDTVFTLHSHGYLKVEFWEISASIPPHKPLWDFIKSISCGNRILSPTEWSEENWKSTHEKSTFEETMTFDLIINN